MPSSWLSNKAAGYDFLSDDNCIVKREEMAADDPKDLREGWKSWLSIQSMELLVSLQHRPSLRWNSVSCP
jgi:hypothetical protein